MDGWDWIPFFYPFPLPASLLSLSLTHEAAMLHLAHEGSAAHPPSQRFSLFLMSAVCLSESRRKPSPCRSISLCCAATQHSWNPSLNPSLSLSDHSLCLSQSLATCPEFGGLATPRTDFVGPVPSNRHLHQKMLWVRFLIFCFFWNKIVIFLVSVVWFLHRFGYNFSG